MLFTELFNGKDNCAVCGQTPCNCTHVTEEKVRLDPKCWKGKKIGNPKTKMKGGVRVNNCVPAESVAEGSNQDLVYISKSKVREFEEWMESEGLETEVPKKDVGEFIVYDYSGQDVTTKSYADDWNEKGQDVAEGYEEEECHVCNGTGEGRTEHENCSHCGGSGMEPADHNDDDYDMYDTDDDYDRGGDDESHYEKYVRTRGLEERMAEAAAWLSEAEPYTGIDPIVRQRMGMAPATQGEIQSYLDKNPPVVRSGSGAPVTSGSGAPVQSGGAVDVAKAADAVSPDRAAAVAKPPGFSAGPGISAATTTPTPVATPSVSTTKLPSQPPVTKPQPPSFSKGVSNIAAANKIADPNKISVGQTIKLPSGQSYTVAKGDTLSGIAAGNFKGATSTPTSTTKPTMPSGTPPKPLGPTPAASTAAPKPTTPTPAPKPTTPAPAPAPSASVPAAKNIYVPNVSGAGQKGPTVAAATGSDTTNPINKLNFGTGNSVPPTTMFNQLPKGSTGAITKETKGKEQPEADYGDDYQQMVLRLKKLAGAGPMKTVYDPEKRVYKNVPQSSEKKITHVEPRDY